MLADRSPTERPEPRWPTGEVLIHVPGEAKPAFVLFFVGGIMAEPAEELALLDLRISECKQLISKQAERVDQLKKRGQNMEDSERLLSNLAGSLVALQQLRGLVLKEVRETPRAS